MQHTIGNQAVQRMLRTASSFPQLSRAQAGGLAQVDVPPVVHDVLAGPGKALDTSTSAFMEQRFGRDFGHVRVHADAAAATSARAIDALAYTAGHHIVFGGGQYAPRTPAGRGLLAHELTHVVQQTAPGAIRRQPKPDKREKEKAKEAQLQELAENPSQAHKAWARLNHVERLSVVVRMSARYGQDFANNFVWYTKNPSKRVLTGEGTNVSYRTPAWYKARGYQLQKRSQGSARDQMLDFWVHPSGHVVGQVVDISSGVSGPPGPSPGPQQPPGPVTPIPPPPPLPPGVDCKQMADMVVEMLDNAIASETRTQTELEAEKGQLEKQNKTYQSYCTRFTQYMAKLKAMKDRAEGDADAIELLRDQLVEAKCSVPFGVNLKLDELRDLAIWADVESSPMATQFLKCITLPGPQDVPGDDEDES